jgi:hypothetical protein
LIALTPHTLDNQGPRRAWFAFFPTGLSCRAAFLPGQAPRVWPGVWPGKTGQPSQGYIRGYGGLAKCGRVGRVNGPYLRVCARVGNGISRSATSKRLFFIQTTRPTRPGVVNFNMLCTDDPATYPDTTRTRMGLTMRISRRNNPDMLNWEEECPELWAMHGPHLAPSWGMAEGQEKEAMAELLDCSRAPA